MLVFGIGLLPRSWALAMGRCLGRLLFRLLRARAQVAVDNLKLIYGDRLEAAQRSKLARRNFAHIGAVAFECLHVAARPRSLGRILRLEGREHLDRALAQGRGVVAFSAHVGNFYLLGAALCRAYPNFRWLFRDPSDPDVSAVYRWLLKRLGALVIADNPRNVCALSLIHI